MRSGQFRRIFGVLTLLVVVAMVIVAAPAAAQDDGALAVAAPPPGPPADVVPEQPVATEVAGEDADPPPAPPWMKWSSSLLQKQRLSQMVSWRLRRAASSAPRISAPIS
ncbi:MAG: hypothetical protein IPK16_13220 [Anaerolineales bacterium]|nr:hypothetical protein [Anaerolineales bacterium]